MPGSVYAWGNNDGGQLGNDNTTSITTPLQVKGFQGAGLLGKIKAVSWGHNEQGQLGDVHH